MTAKNPVEQMLNVALATATRHFEFYHDAAQKVATPEVKALLLILADSEGKMIDEIRDMMVTGILDEIEKVTDFNPAEDPPDDTPFAPERMDTDPRIYVCNKALQQEIRGYTFYLSIATRAKSEMISRLFEYFANIKAQQIKRIRKVCQHL
ncbi:MAG: hypothetical protein ACTSV3_04665 [Candidatus Thorarchaeota archaeon]|nr:MAG: hypothetical protein DRP09_14130 [Candidatus Thorarchaeota archaeon]RLI54866.1 MAG: hypothetical protein DRO87_09620 [Candidatus Thorarchaeota archaeon]